jgi:hypothetical protein
MHRGATGAGKSISFRPFMQRKNDQRGGRDFNPVDLQHSVVVASKSRVRLNSYAPFRHARGVTPVILRNMRTN